MSPLLRCRQTAEILFPGVEQQVEPELRECDFGLFEGKNYEELKDVPAYRRWLESGGELPFPEGESRGDFTLRCCHSFRDLVEDAITKQCRLLVLVVHGGTIMSILERYAVPARSYFEWQVGNGCGFLLEADPLRWQCSREISLKETFTL